MKLRRLLALLLLLVGVNLVTVRPAHALHKNVQRLLVFGGYGLAAGTLAGLASVPLSQDIRTMFIGSSVGMYLGIAVGVYYIIAFNDPDNPIRPKPGDPRTGLLPDFAPPAPHTPLVWVQVPVVRF